MKRYDLDMDHYNTGSLTIYGLKPHKDGAWVKHEEADSLVTALEQRLATAEAMNKKLAKFFVGAIQCSFDGCDYGGDEIQDDALAIGLIEECDPPEGEESPWYRIVDDIKKYSEGKL